MIRLSNKELKILGWALELTVSNLTEDAEFMFPEDLTEEILEDKTSYGNFCSNLFKDIQTLAYKLGVDRKYVEHFE